MPRLLRTPQANEDLLEIWSYIADDSPEAAEIFEDISRLDIELLSRQEDRGRGGPFVGRDYALEDHPATPFFGHAAEGAADALRFDLDRFILHDRQTPLRRFVDGVIKNLFDGTIDFDTGLLVHRSFLVGYRRGIPSRYQEKEILATMERRYPELESDFAAIR